jgi:hypothetical protein
MTIQLTTLCRNARLNAIETYAGTAAVFNIYQLTAGSAAPDANTAAVPGTVLAAITCPSDYLNAASGGSITLLGTWSDTAANAAGTAGFFRMCKTDGTTCVLQGTMGTAAADMIVDNAVFAAGQTFTITAFTLTDGNA